MKFVDALNHPGIGASTSACMRSAATTKYARKLGVHQKDRRALHFGSLKSSFHGLLTARARKVVLGMFNFYWMAHCCATRDTRGEGRKKMPRILSHSGESVKGPFGERFKHLFDRQSSTEFLVNQDRSLIGKPRENSVTTREAFSYNFIYLFISHLYRSPILIVYYWRCSAKISPWLSFIYCFY